MRHKFFGILQKESGRIPVKLLLGTLMLGFFLFWPVVERVDAQDFIRHSGTEGPVAEVRLLERFSEHSNSRPAGLFQQRSLSGEYVDVEVPTAMFGLPPFYRLDKVQEEVEIFPSGYSKPLPQVTIALPVVGEGGVARLEGEVGIKPDIWAEQEASVHFTVSLLQESSEKILWSSTDSGVFDLMVPYAEGSSFFLSAQTEDGTPLQRVVWRKVLLSTSPVSQGEPLSGLQARLSVPATADLSKGDWTKTGLRVEAGQYLQIRANGYTHYGSEKNFKYMAKTYSDGERHFPKNPGARPVQYNVQPPKYEEASALPAAPVGALIGRMELAEEGVIEVEEEVQPFFLGKEAVWQAPSSGWLLFGYNDVPGSYGGNWGEYEVDIRYLFPTEAAALLAEPEVKGLRFQPESLRLLPGKSAKFVLQLQDEAGNWKDITKDADVTYRNYFPNMLTLKDGQVRTNKEEGTALVTATYRDLKAGLTITVSSNFPARIAPMGSSFSVNVGDALPVDIMATYIDRSVDTVTRNVEWVVEKPDIASVDREGRIIGLSPGSTRVTAHYYDIATTSFSVRVK